MALSLRDRLKLFTVDEIKAELKSLNAICTGVKDVLVDRLAYYIERNSSTRDPSDGNIFHFSFYIFDQVASSLSFTSIKS